MDVVQGLTMIPLKAVTLAIKPHDPIITILFIIIVHHLRLWLLPGALPLRLDSDEDVLRAYSVDKGVGECTDVVHY